MLEAAEQIERFKEFFEAVYNKELLEAVSAGKTSLRVDFAKFSAFDPRLAVDLLESPEEAIKAAELSIRETELPSEIKNFRVRVHNIPESQRLMIREIRSNHIGKLLAIEGIIRRKSDVRPQVVNTRFECPNCGNIISVLQLETTFREPHRCGCGRKGNFRLLEKELVDAQSMVLEEAPEMLEGGDQPRRMGIFLKEDLVSPISEKRTNPGNRVRIVGILKEVPVVKHGSRLTNFDLHIDTNYIETIDEDFYEIKISKDDEAAILAIAKDKRVYEKLITSIAPSIYGYERVKEALLLQLMGGVQKKRSDGVVSRGDIHILLIGDPGCIAGDSRVSLYYKGMRPIQELGTQHLQEIREIVSKIRKNKDEKPYDVATKFHIYGNQPVLTVKTETGKSVTATYNQPFLTEEGWKRADKLSIGEKIRVMPSVPNTIKKLKTTNFAAAKRKPGHLKENVRIPEYFTPELAAICGYVVGDGNIHTNGYRVTCYVNDEEKDLIGKLNDLVLNTFNVLPRIVTANNTAERFIDSGNGVLRQILSTQTIHLVEINSKQVAMNLSFLGEKTVPQEIFESPKKVIKAFLSWLFEADGTAFGNGRGRTSVQLKSRSPQLLQDVQLLLLYFGIQARITQDNLSVRRAHDINRFAECIGFQSAKKIKRLTDVVESLKLRTQHLRKGLQRYEKVVQISQVGIMDVFDFEVPKSRSFVANGIVCHNSGKSQLLKRISVIAPKGRYVSGGGISGAGITAAVVKDEILGGWSLEAGALVLANNGICSIDEMDKMSEEDSGAMHEALEQQTVSVAKANIQATLIARTTVLAAANPKYGRFDQYGNIAEQINMPPTLINRFDLIFPIKDQPQIERDEKTAKHILQLHQTPEIQEPEISTQILKKYVSYARQKIRPVLTDAAIDEIKEFYVQLRNREVSDERAARVIPISPRQLEALVRMSEASARIRLSEKVTREDARKAIELLVYCLMQIGREKETGQIDIDRIATGIPASQREKIFVIKQILEELEQELGKTIPVEDVARLATEKGLSKSEVDEIIEKLKRSGDVYEPRYGFLSRM